jgi:hypothetical protein
VAHDQNVPTMVSPCVPPMPSDGTSAMGGGLDF